MIFRDNKAAEMFAKFIRLLGSDQDGERAAAAMKATHLLKSNGLDWHAVASAVCGQSPAPQPRKSHQADAADCLRSPVSWKPHERDFLRQMQEQMRSPSEKQRDWLDSLMDRARRAMA